MTVQRIVEFADGTKVVFGAEREAGLAEVGAAEEVVKVTGETFKAGLGALAGLVAALEDSIGQMAHRPDKIEMEFGASLSGECDLWVVSGEGKADFKVKVVWDKHK
jgi:hypothetical protein